MSKDLTLENASLRLSKENDNVRVYNDLIPENVVLINLDMDSASAIIKENFEVVNNYYKARIENAQGLNFEPREINLISISVVLHYLYMYNNWRNTYKNKQNLNLSFNKDDFNNVSSFDLITGYFRKRYPNDWVLRSSILLGMAVEDFTDKYQERDKFYKR